MELNQTKKGHQMLINWRKKGLKIGQRVGSTDEFQKICINLQSAYGVILDGASDYRSQEGTACNAFWSGFHEGRNLTHL